MLTPLRDLRNNNWSTGLTIPFRPYGREGDCFLKTTTQVVFRKMIPKLNTLIFDKTSCAENVTVSDDYFKCNGPMCKSPTTGNGIKTLPIKLSSKLLFSFKINSLGSDFPYIGFCDDNSNVITDPVIDSVLWKINETTFRFIKNNKTVQLLNIFDRAVLLKAGDVIQMAVDFEKNAIWFGVNDAWGSGRPNVFHPTSVQFLPDFLGGIQPNVYVIPNGAELEIIQYPFRFPSLYEQAMSIPVLDWYQTSKYVQEGFK